MNTLSRIFPRESSLLKGVLIGLGLGIAPAIFAQSNFQPISESVLNEARNRPLNLANSGVGTKVKPLSKPTEQEIGDTSDLISEDVGEPLKFEKGTHTYLFEMKVRTALSKFFIKSLGAKGTVRIFNLSSPNQPREEWQKLGDDAPLQPGKVTAIEFSFTPTQFVVIDFEIVEAGQVSRFSMSGEDTLNQVASMLTISPDALKIAKANAEKLVPHNFANLQNGGKITHISSGDPSKAPAMIDNDPSTAFEFPNVESSHSIIIDLKNGYEVIKFAMVIEAAFGNLQIYKLDQLPDGLSESQASGEPVALDDDFFANMSPAINQTFNEKVNQVNVSLDNFTSQYILIRWNNLIDSNLPPTLFTESSPTSLKIYEIGLVGQIPEDLQSLAYVPRAEFMNAESNPAAGGILGFIPGPELPETPETPPTLPPDIGVVSP